MNKSKLNLLMYLGAGIFFFFFWLIWVFPTDALKSRILTEIENQTQGQYKIDVTSLDVSLFGSLTFNNLKVSEGAGDDEKVLLKTPRLKLSFSPFSLSSLATKPDFDFYLKGSKGDLRGNYRRDGDNFQLSAKFNKFPISDLGVIGAKAKLNLSGDLNGELNFKLNRSDPNKNSGNIALDFVNLAVDSTQISLPKEFEDTVQEAVKSIKSNNPIKVGMKEGASGPILDVGGVKLSGAKQSGIQGEVKKDNLEFRSIALQDGDLNLNLSGRVILQGPKAGDYRLAMQGGFSVTDNLRDALVFIFFLIKDQKNAQGVYPLNITGRLGSPGVRIGTFNFKS